MLIELPVVIMLSAYKATDHHPKTDYHVTAKELHRSKEKLLSGKQRKKR